MNDNTQNPEERENSASNPNTTNMNTTNTPHKPWPRVKLGDVCEVITGSTPKTSNKSYWDGIFPWITPAEISNDSKVIFDTKRHLTKDGVKSASLKSFPNGTVLLTSRAPIGKVAIAGNEMYCNQGFKNLICSKKIYNYYLYYFLKSSTDYLNSIGHGSTFKEISKSIVENITLPLPPLPEQRALVARLDRELGLVDAITKKFEALEKAANSEFKATLKEAFDEISPKCPNSINTTPHSSTQWVKLGDVCEIGYGYTTKSIPFNKKLPHYLRITDIQNDFVNWDIVPSCECPELENYRLNVGDIVFARTGATTGKSFLLKGNFPLSIFASYLIRVVINNQKQLLPEYLKYFFDSPEYWKTISSGMAGAAQGGFNSKKLASLTLPLPPLPEQHALVARLDAAREKRDKLVALAKRGREMAGLWRKAILKEAFE